MKKITYSIGFAFALLATSSAVAQQGFGTNRPDKSAAVEIKSPNKGLLIPRIALTGATDNTTIANPANSLLVYNTSTQNGMLEGYYFWKAGAVNKWIPFISELNQQTSSVSGQDLVNVDSTPTGTNTDYKVSLMAGLDKQFLASQEVTPGVFKTVWVNYGDIIEATNGLTKTGNTIKLGGTLTEDTTLNTGGKKVMVQGLSTVTSMVDQVVAVGHNTTGEVKVATPKQIVDAGTTANLSSAVNDMKLTFNGVDYPAKIILANDLSIETGTTILKSSVNGVEDTQDLKPAIQKGQVKYEVLAGTGVTVVPDVTNPDNIKYTVNASAGGITLAGDVTGAANANTVGKIQGVPVSASVPTTGQILKEVAGTWTPSTLSVSDLPDGKVMSSTDLDITPLVNKALLQNLTVNIKDDAVKAVKLNDDTAGAGLVRNTTTKALDVNAKNGLMVSDDFVKLGGPLTEKTTLTTDAVNTLAIAGLEDFTGAEKSIVVLGPGNVLQKASLTTSNAIATKAADYTATLADETILVNAAANSVTVTLPAADAANKGKRFYVKLVATNAANTNEVLISSVSSIDGLPTGAEQIASSNPFQSWLLQSDGTAWFVVGN